MKRFFTFILLMGLSCTNSEDSPASTTVTDTGSDSYTAIADTLAVEVTGQEGSYTFAVTVQSPDTGCKQYTDWWEVITTNGTLVYRRILLHSHVDEQPFTRDGGPVKVGATDTLIVRAHMFPIGYGGDALRGSIGEGFKSAPEITADFAAELVKQDPLPEDCLY